MINRTTIKPLVILLISISIFTSEVYANNAQALADFAQNARRPRLESQAANAPIVNNLNPFTPKPRGESALYAPETYPATPADFDCVRMAAFDHKVPLKILLAINSVEGGRNGQYVRNTNSTQDMGQFQINTIHLSTFKKYGATQYDLSTRGCYNAQAAAYLLSKALAQPNKQHLDIFTRSAGYHSWTPHVNAIYKQKLVRYIQQWDSWLAQHKLPQ